MTDITKDVIEAIEKHLPTHVGSLLQSELKMLSDLKKQIPEMEDKIKKQNREIIDQSDIISNHKELEMSIQEVNDMKVTQQNLGKILALREQHATEKVAMIQGLVETCFKSPDMRRGMDFNLWGNFPMADNGGYVSQQQMTLNGNIEDKK